MDKDEYIAKAKAAYMAEGGLNASDAHVAAETCFDERDSTDADPVEDAREDMLCWRDDA